MSTNIYLYGRTQNKHSWEADNKCCDMQASHFAIIAKGNIIDGIEAEA